MPTAEAVLNAFRRATDLAKRLPAAGPKGIGNPWPEILRYGHEGYVDAKESAQPLTALEMAEYETTMTWLGFIKEPVYRRILLAYSAGVPGWRIAKAIHPKISQPTVSRRVLWALGFIAVKLDMGETPPPIEYQGC